MYKLNLRFAFFVVLSFSQAMTSFSQLVLNSGAVVKLNGGTSGSPIYFILNTPPATPISTSGTSGIVMEAEYNVLKYNLGTALTAITVPYLSNNLELIPLTLSPSAVGVGSGNINFSAVIPASRATGFDNDGYKPSDVTNMGSVGITNNSDKTIDRFWIIDANGYSTKPAVTLDFTYIDAEWATNTGNTITEANLGAQRFNNTVTIRDWEGFGAFAPAGTINTAANTVSGVSVSAANFYRSWTLNDRTVPLPIELINFEANCVNNKTVLSWCTATETNNRYFTIAQSTDGINFTPIDIVNGSGTSSQKHCYQYTVQAQQDATTYYQLWQTDVDQTVKKLKIISAQPCDGKTGNVTITNDGTKQVTLFLNSLIDSNDEVEVHNTLGQIVMEQTISTQKGSNQFNLNLSYICNGIYYVSIIRNNQSLTSKKIIIADN